MKRTTLMIGIMMMLMMVSSVSAEIQQQLGTIDAVDAPAAVWSQEFVALGNLKAITAACDNAGGSGIYPEYLIQDATTNVTLYTLGPFTSNFFTREDFTPVSLVSGTLYRITTNQSTNCVYNDGGDSYPQGDFYQDSVEQPGYDLFMTLWFDECTPDWGCTGYGECLPINGGEKTCNTVSDNNACGTNYTGNYSEFALQTCVYGGSGGGSGASYQRETVVLTEETIEEPEEEEPTAQPFSLFGFGDGESGDFEWSDVPLVGAFQKLFSKITGIFR